MAVAFHLLAHRHPDQVARLLTAIWHPENTYILHYDRRRPREEHAAIRHLSDGRPNVLLQPSRAVLWGRFSLYSAQHDGLRIALACGRPWTHWINLSGQCFPLRPVSVIMQAAEAAGEFSFVPHFDPLHSQVWKHPEKRLRHYHLDLPALEKLLRLPGLGRHLRARIFGGADSIPRLPWVRRRLPSGFTWYGGDNWVALSRAAAEHLVHAHAAAKIIQALRHSALPEESIFQSVLLNSPLAGRVHNQLPRYINWHAGEVSPRDFTPEDFPRLAAAASEGIWLARKFTHGCPLLNRIEQDLLSSP